MVFVDLVFAFSARNPGILASAAYHRVQPTFTILPLSTEDQAATRLVVEEVFAYMYEERKSVNRKHA